MGGLDWDGLVCLRSNSTPVPHLPNTIKSQELMKSRKPCSLLSFILYGLFLLVINAPRLLSWFSAIDHHFLQTICQMSSNIIF